jgi:acyl-CoA reductase-like NAD-dependent aldehyde dehydrogenase
MADMQQTVSPIDGSLYVERTLATRAEIDRALDAARKAFSRLDAPSPVAERAALLDQAAVDAFRARGPTPIAEEITRQMGRPLGQVQPGRGARLRRARPATWRIAIGEGRWARSGSSAKASFTRFIRREPLGVVFVVAPWNYPYLTAVNAVDPGADGGQRRACSSTRHQTPLCAERFFAEPSAPPGCRAAVFQFLHLSHDDTTRLIKDKRRRLRRLHRLGGRRPRRAAGGGQSIHRHRARARRQATRPMSAPDANLPHAVENLVDGAFFNSRPILLRHSSASTSTRTSTSRSSRAPWRSRSSIGWAIRSIPRQISGRWCAPRPPTRSASRRPARCARERGR